MHFTTFNAWDLRGGKRRVDMRRVGRQSGIIAWQEIEPGSGDPATLRRILTPARWHHVGLGRVPCPLSIRSRRFTVLDEGWQRLSDRVRGVNPPRWVTWAVVDATFRPRLDPFLVASVHMTNGAWNRRKLATRRARRRLWNEQWGELAELVQAWNDDGLSVLIGGDLNRTQPLPMLLPGARVLGSARIDHVLARTTDGGVGFRAAGTDVFRQMHSDHPAVRVDVRLIRKG